ncbi:MAG: ferric reductase-like transmembrane domain-containing protein [Demequinaceae bacterium]|nr:ferric reductase-like transmembrane domain-containing protein [Demequinaceae bacterium]
MATTAIPTSLPTGTHGVPVDRDRAIRARRLSLWRDGLEAAAWLVTVAGISFFLASGAMVWTVRADVLNSLGRLLGIIATVLILVQVLLASRAPWIERALGHDKALKLHGAMGQPVFLILVAHAAFLTIGYGSPTGRDIVAQTAYFLGHTRDIALSIIALAILLVVAVTSIAAARRRWPYETWHAIHLFAYIAIAIAVPHQFTDGTTFKYNAWARGFWASLYAIAFGSLLLWRVLVPAVRALRHRLVISGIERHDDGSVSVTMVGRRLDGWNARPGQFFLWRFYTKELWLTAHPYSLSAVPDGRSLRITVKPLGDDSAAVGRLSPGTRVSASGPYGRFVHDARVRPGLVLVGAGIGIAPVRAMIEGYRAGDGQCDVVVRGSSDREVPLLDEMRTLAAERGARIHEVFGHRGDGWSTVDGPQTLALLVPALPDCDVFVCGPEAWADLVREDALECGVAREAIHVEEYDW